MHGSGGLEFNNCARQRFSLHGIDLTKFDGGGARDKEVIPSIRPMPIFIPNGMFMPIIIPEYILKTTPSCKSRLTAVQVSDIAVFRMHVTSVVLAHRSKMCIACIIRM